MRGKRAYRRTDVKKINAEELRDRAILLGEAGTSVGLDIGKDEIVVCLRWANGEFDRPWKVSNTAQIGLLMERLLILKEVCEQRGREVSPFYLQYFGEESVVPSGTLPLASKAVFGWVVL